MNHDYAHCMDYRDDCPMECFRARLTKEALDKHWTMACFLLARTGEKMDMSDDMILDIFWEQISSFISGNEKYYTDACDKKSQKQKERWAELKRLRAEKAMRDGTEPPDDDIGDDEDLPFGDNM